MLLNAAWSVIFTAPLPPVSYTHLDVYKRQDYPNQINNVLAFPGIFRGALDVRATKINDEMKIAAAHAIASLIPPEELSDQYIIPNPFNRDVAPVIAKAVMEAARKSGVAQL